MPVYLLSVSVPFSERTRETVRPLPLPFAYVKTQKANSDCKILYALPSLSAIRLTETSGGERETQTDRQADRQTDRQESTKK